jgi:hypothetical protein
MLPEGLFAHCPLLSYLTIRSNRLTALPTVLVPANNSLEELFVIFFAIEGHFNN